MNILLLGTGYVSSKIQKYWNDDSLKLITASNKEFNYINGNNFINLQKETKCDFIINTYGYTGSPNVDSCETNKEECFKRNVLDNYKILSLSNVPNITISSGCIYNDDKNETQFTEEHPHNFGMNNPTSSYYSYCKSYFETILINDDMFNKLNNNYLLRIRMPFDNDLNDNKNYIGKILKYDKLINYQNSLTHLKDLTDFIKIIINKKIPSGIYNVVNDGPINTDNIINLANFSGKYNKNVCKYYTVDDMLSMGLMKCRRSNCVLDNSKMKKYFKPVDSYTRLFEIFNTK